MRKLFVITGSGLLAIVNFVATYRRKCSTCGGWPMLCPPPLSRTRQAGDAYLHRVETGKTNPSFRLLKAIADYHGIRLSRLLRMAEDKYSRRRH